MLVRFRFMPATNWDVLWPCHFQPPDQLISDGETQAAPRNVSLLCAEVRISKSLYKVKDLTRADPGDRAVSLALLQPICCSFPTRGILSDTGTGECRFEG